MKHHFYQHFPDDLRAGRLARLMAYGGTLVGFVAPFWLLFSPGLGGKPIRAAVALALFHLVILLSMPMGAPLECNAFMVFGIFTLFVDKADVGLGDLDHARAGAILMALIIGAVLLGTIFPHRGWFLPPNMRYYAGNANTTLWCMAKHRLQKLCTSEEPELLYQGYALRAMSTSGRALFTLVDRVIPMGRETDYPMVDGAWVCAAVTGLHFADGTMHNEQLVAALQRRYRFEPGEVRIVILDAQPIHRQDQRYRLIDAATGEFERGRVKVADLVSRQPSADDVPVYPYP